MSHKITEKSIHDFASKLRQASCVNMMKEYIRWRRQSRGKQGDKNISMLPRISPVSINLDLTVACNYHCDHCVDNRILNTGHILSYDDAVRTIDYLSDNNLKAVILIGGGEPTLHHQFREIVKYIKKKNLQLGISTNGSWMDKILEVAEYFEKPDWVRLSLDSGIESSFQRIHRPNKRISLNEIFKKVKELKVANEKVLIGFSYIVIWKGCKFRDFELSDNVEEMPIAAKMAAESGFDYISFKPCLIKLENENENESLFYYETPEEKAAIVERIRLSLEESRRVVEGKINVVETLNMHAILEDKIEEFMKYPHTCHIQVFNHVVTPIGIFNCPAYRGTEWAKLGDGTDYSDRTKALQVRKNSLALIDKFDPGEQCKDIVCFYHFVNWWLDDMVNSEINLDEIPVLDDNNFFI